MNGMKILLGLMLGASLPVLSYDSTPYDAADRADTAYQAREYALAIEHYEAALDVLPGVVEWSYNQANAYYMREDYVRALVHYTHALNQDRGALRSRIEFNMGNAKYQQALEAMQTFRDAKQLLEVAIAHYRESLVFDPDQPDALYNLEMAHRLLRQMREANAMAPQTEDVREQRSQQNQGIPLQGQSQHNRPSEDDSDAEAQEKADAQAAEQSVEEEASTGKAAEMDQPSAPQEMSQQEADRTIKMIRDRSKAARARRNESARTQMQDAQVAKYW